MNMRETVRHSGKGAFFSGGALPVMRPLSKFSDSCLSLHSYCRTEEIKFSIKPITRKTNSKSMIILQNKIQNAINQTHVRIL